jgi:hypothetical protein
MVVVIIGVGLRKMTLEKEVDVNKKATVRLLFC